MLATILHRLVHLAMLVTALPASAATFAVNSTADVVDATPGDSVCETVTGGGTCTLRAAVLEANALAGADVVTLPAGIFTITSPNPGLTDTAAVADYDVTGDLQISGAGAAVTIVEDDRELSLPEQDRIFDIAPGATVGISAMTIRYGFSYEGGGGIRNAGMLALSDCHVSQNSGPSHPAEANGGGIHNDATLTIARCDIAQNRAFNGLGGGIYNEGTLAIDDSTVRENGAVAGGGIANGGSLTMRNSTVAYNGASGTATMIGNFEGAGAGILDTGGNASLEHVTVAFNPISDFLGQPMFGNAYGTGAGLGVFTGVTTTGYTIRSTIIYANNDPVFVGLEGNCGYPKPTSLGHNLEDSFLCMLTEPGDQLGASSVLGFLDDYGGPTPTFALNPNGPAVDAADAGACPPADQRGTPRPQGGGCDVGAYESNLPCGDGDLDPGEQCDDGDPSAGDCCSFLCQYVAAAGSCELDGEPCTDDRCDGAGTCAQTAIVECPACRTCLGGACVVRPRTACRIAADLLGTLVVKPDSLLWRWILGVQGTTSAEFDPLAGDDYGLCVFDGATATEGRLILDAQLPAGALCNGHACWNAVGLPPGSRGFRYRDRQRSHAGVDKILLRPGPAYGGSRIIVKGKGPNLGLTNPLDVELPVLIQLQRVGGACWQAAFRNAVIDEPDFLKARSSQLLP